MSQPQKAPISMIVAVMIGGFTQFVIPIPAIGFLIGFVPAAIYIGKHNMSITSGQ